MRNRPKRQVLVSMAHHFVLHVFLDMSCKSMVLLSVADHLFFSANIHVQQSKTISICGTSSPYPPRLETNIFAPWKSMVGSRENSFWGLAYRDKDLVSGGVIGRLLIIQEHESIPPWSLPAWQRKDDIHSWDVNAPRDLPKKSWFVRKKWANKLQPKGYRLTQIYLMFFCQGDDVVYDGWSSDTSLVSQPSWYHW